MTTPSTQRKAGPLLGTGVQTTWPFTFKIFAATDIAVTIVNSSGIETLLTYNVDYSVSVNANQDTSPGGTVTYPISGTPLPVGSRLVIIGDIDYDQPLDLPSGGNFSPLALENQLDRATMQIQQLKEGLDRALTLPVAASGSTELPYPDANKLIGWDSSGSSLQNVDQTTLATIVAFATANANIFTGDGTTTTYALSANPGAQANLDVAIGGVTQLPGTDYTWTGGQTVTFTTAPPAGVKILIRYFQALPQGVTDASLVTYSAATSYTLGSIGYSLKALEQTVSGLSVSSPPTGVFFDTAAGDSFTAKLSYPTNAALTVTPSKAAFSAASATVSDLKLKQPDGNLLKFCFDNWTAEATYTVTSFPAADAIGFLTGFLDFNSAPFGGEIKAHPGSATLFFAREYLNNAIVANDTSGVSFSPGDKVVVQLVYSGNTLTFNFTYAANPLRTISATMVFSATSYELPRLFVNPAIRMTSGVFEMNSLKIYAKYPGAKYAFVGDSITQGRFCTNFADAFPQLMRTQFPNGVLVCGAPAAKVGDWLTPAYSVTSMLPRYAFVMLGTNDVVTSTPLATTQANYLTLLGQFVSAGITPIILTVPPNGNSNTPTLNTWLKTLGYSYIDIYATLLGTGTSMNATYNSGDGVHPNTAGNLAIYNAIMTFIQANGL